MGMLILVLKLKTNRLSRYMIRKLADIKENSSTHIRLETTGMVQNKQKYLTLIVSPTSEAPVKQQYRNYVKEARHKRYCNVTGLSKYVFELKRNNKTSWIR